nr:reverse transcriptase domain-containing protein [Tanacetum cinerariifolium]
MSSMANTTPLVTNVTKPATNPRDADATPRVNILEFCEESCEDILPIIMDKVRRDRRKDVHTRLDFGEGPRERTREDSHHTGMRARTTKPKRLKVQDRLRYGDCHVLDRLGHRRQIALDTSSKDHPNDRERFRSVGESYDDSFSHSYRDGNGSRHMKKRRDNESPLSSGSESDSSDGRTRMPNNVKTYDGTVDPKDHVKIFQAAAQVERWAMPTWCHMFNSTLIWAARVWFDELPPKSIDSYKYLKAAFLAYFMKQKKYVKDPVEIHNIKQKDGETIEDFMKRFKVETGRMKGALSTMEEMMITTTAFIRGEVVAASKKKGHASWKAQDQSKRQNSDKSQWRNRGTVRHRSKNGRTHDSSHVCDGGSSMEILNEHYFNRLRPEINSQMVPATTSLTGFSGKTIWPLGQLRLLVIIGDAYHSTRAWMNFMIVRLLSHYNGIIERPKIREFQAVPSTLMLKFPVEGGIVTIRSTILIPTECTSVITSSVVSNEERTRPDNFKVALHQDFPDQELAIEGTLSDKGRTELCSILKKKLNIFSWKPSDMIGVSRWQMCVDFTDLNKACPKDCYPLPKIDWKVESLCGYPFKCFLDAYKGYRQIQLAELDEEKTAFHTGQGVYCYTKMPFGLKIASATYLRLMDKAFKSQIGQNIEVYVNDLVVKSYTEAEMLRDIGETFRTLRKIKMKLNPKRCAFGLAEGVFLGPRTSVKGHILADFLIEMPDENPQAAPVAETQQEPWTLFTNGSSCVDGSASNNKAEYEELIAGIRITAQMGVKNVHVSIDSKLVANQVLGTYVAKEDNMVKYLDKVKSLVRGFTNFSISQVPQSKNKQADALNKIVSTSFVHLSKRVLVEVLKDKSIKEKEEGGKKAPHQSPTVLVNGGNSLQAIIPHAVVKMCWTAPGGDIDIAGRFPEGPVKHLQSNRPVERENRSLGEGIKARLGERNKNWVEELPHVLWAHPTMIKSSHGDTPFSLTYRTEEVIPTKIGMPTYCTTAVDVVSNDLELRLNLDLLEEWRRRVAICEAKAKSKMTKYYNARVRGVTFRPGDFIYRSNDASHAIAGGKLGPK